MLVLFVGNSVGAVCAEFQVEILGRLGCVVLRSERSFNRCRTGEFPYIWPKIDG